MWAHDEPFALTFRRYQVTISTETVPWTDPRVAALHEALFAETGALYKPDLDALSPAGLAAARGSLAVDPAEIAVTLLVLDNTLPVATAAVRPSHLAPDTEWEVKRVYVADDYRGRGLSKALMLDLHERATAAGMATIVLQTGGLQAAAHGLYEGLGYERVGVYPPYGFFPGERYYRKTFAPSHDVHFRGL
jgi:GNAT superfamily N-acetyltransferase